MTSRAFIILLISIAIASADKFVNKPTTEGPVRGLRTSAIETYLGIPFARPPIGALRFAPPQAPLKRNQVRNATFVRDACMQTSSPIPMSEDCLYLNIYKPLGAKNAAVMIWVHGGSFTGGTGATFDGTFLSQGSNTIVVTVNYRLGAFGFLALNETLAADGTTGNYGIQDQRAAFSWVKKNIKKFGGNPSKITIAGESAGAFSICTHLAAPKSRGLFRGAIMESIYQNCDAIAYKTAAATGEGLLKSIGCDVADKLSCLKNAPASAILNVSSSGITWKPVLDGAELVKQPFEYIQNGSFAKVPILIGTNQDEAAFIVCGTPSQYITSAQLTNFIASNFGSVLTQRIDALYNFSSYAAPFRALIAVETDYLFKCATKQLTNLIDGIVPVWMYSFNYLARGQCAVAHATEVPFLFPSRSDILGASYSFDQSELKLSATMRKHWITFVQTLNPNYSNEQVSWPQYVEPAEQFIEFNVTLSVGNHFRSDYCPFWNSFVPL